MAEEQILTGDRANNRLKKLLKMFHWDGKTELERDIPCKRRDHNSDEHGIDGFLAYDDPYVNKRRGVVIESKSKKWSSWKKSSLSKASNQIRTAMECITRSEEFSKRLSLDEDLVVDSAILGAWTNDEAEDEDTGFDSGKFDSYVSSQSVKQAGGGPYHVVILANDDLNRIASVHNKHESIKRKYTEGTDPENREIRNGTLEFFYPSVHEPRSAPQRNKCLSFDYLYSDIIFAKLNMSFFEGDDSPQDESLNSKEVTVVYHFDEFTRESLDYLYQAIKENEGLDADEVWIYTYGKTTEEEDSDFQGLVNHAKKSFLPPEKEFKFNYLPKVHFKSYTADLEGNNE